MYKAVMTISSSNVYMYMYIQRNEWTIQHFMLRKAKLYLYLMVLVTARCKHKRVWEDFRTKLGKELPNASI